MPSNKIGKKVVSGKAWMEEQLTSALTAVEANPQRSQRAIAKEFNISESTLRARLKLKRERGTIELEKCGRKPTLDKNTELEISSCIDILCKNGFSPTFNDIQNQIQKYVKKKI